MKIEDILDAALVLPRLAGRSKSDVLEELSAAVTSRHPEIDRERLVHALEERERLNSTALGDGVAIPHGKLSGIKRVFAAFGRSPEGVDFLSLDGKPTHLFFLLGLKFDRLHLPILGRLARILKHPDVVRSLRAAPTLARMRDILLHEDVKALADPPPLGKPKRKK